MLHLQPWVIEKLKLLPAQDETVELMRRDALVMFGKEDADGGWVYQNRADALDAACISHGYTTLLVAHMGAPGEEVDEEMRTNGERVICLNHKAMIDVRDGGAIYAPSPTDWGKPQ